MLTCPHCLHTFESPPSGSGSQPPVPPRCCAAASPALLAPPSPCVRVFADSGGGLVLTPSDKCFPTIPGVQVSFSQPSPAVQLSFVLPTPSSWFPVVPAVSPPLRTDPSSPGSDTDLSRLSSTQRALRASGWYYEGLSWQESAATLERCSPGTFLVRDSSDPRFLFSLSVQTTRGPTSVRLHYVDGLFRLDAEEHLARFVPTFDCVVRLVEHYVALGARKRQEQGDRDRHVWVDLRGHMYSPILLTRPRRRDAPSLQHLARLAINRQLGSETAVSALCLPPTIEAYLRDYPFTQ